MSPAADAAAAALGWPGHVVADMRLFGRRVTVVAEVDERAHRIRRTNGWPPVTDRMSIALWAWPEHHATVPPAAVTLSGVLAIGTRWRPTLRAAAGFVGFASTAILLEQPAGADEHCLITAQLHGIAVLRAAPSSPQVDLIQPGRVGPVPAARPSVVSRWVEELVYQRLLDDDRLAAREVDTA